MTPHDRIADLSPSATRVLLAVVAGNRTHASIAEAAGLTRTSTMRELRLLARLRLVEWEDWEHGTIRPMVEVVS